MRRGVAEWMARFSTCPFRCGGSEPTLAWNWRPMVQGAGGVDPEGVSLTENPESTLSMTACAWPFASVLPQIDTPQQAEAGIGDDLTCLPHLALSPCRYRRKPLLPGQAVICTSRPADQPASHRCSVVRPSVRLSGHPTRLSVCLPFLSFSQLPFSSLSQATLAPSRGAWLSRPNHGKDSTSQSIWPTKRPPHTTSFLLQISQTDVELTSSFSLLLYTCAVFAPATPRTGVQAIRARQKSSQPKPVAYRLGSGRPGVSTTLLLPTLRTTPNTLAIPRLHFDSHQTKTGWLIPQSSRPLPKWSLFW
ncbi:unnamed protein product [Protopolystoma xenopodis]|uniref:Uncharacterized protein n=1 Tax=Protopolystoma xenopodis TaxID=117903 RepID=A0A3S5FCB9_9PLAT|nr:unnamed protein product [Protopolystoma xenopodis]